MAAALPVTIPLSDWDTYHRPSTTGLLPAATRMTIQTYADKHLDRRAPPLLLSVTVDAKNGAGLSTVACLPCYTRISGTTDQRWGWLLQHYDLLSRLVSCRLLPRAVLDSFLAYSCPEYKRSNIAQHCILSGAEVRKLVGKLNPTHLQHPTIYAAYQAVAPENQWGDVATALDFVTDCHAAPSHAILYLNYLSAWALALGRTDSQTRDTASYLTIGAPPVTRFFGLVVSALARTQHPLSLMVGGRHINLSLEDICASVLLHVGHHPVIPHMVKACLFLFPAPAQIPGSSGVTTCAVVSLSVYKRCARRLTNLPCGTVKAWTAGGGGVKPSNHHRAYTYMVPQSKLHVPAACPPPFETVTIGGMPSASHGVHADILSYAYFQLANRPNNPLPRVDAKQITRLFPYTSSTDRRHMTTRFGAILSRFASPPPTFLRGNRGNIAVCSRTDLQSLLSAIPIGQNQVAALCALICGAYSKHKSDFVSLYANSGILCTLQPSFKDVCKSVSAHIRKYATNPFSDNPLPPSSVAANAYLEIAIGRSKNVSDWAEEKNHRCHMRHEIQSPKLPSVGLDGRLIYTAHELGSTPKPDKHFYAELRKELEALVGQLINQRHITEPLGHFYNRRSEWITSGSSGGFRSKQLYDLIHPGGVSPKTRDQPEVHSKPGVVLDKRGWAEHTPYPKIQGHLNKATPAEKAVASEKYENGKARAIYGVDPYHYVLNTYVTQGMEEALHKIPGFEKGAQGAAELYYQAKKALSSADPDLECTMLDYADFNIQHTLYAQHLMFEVILEKGQAAGACKDWVDAAKWISQAKLNQEVSFPASFSRGTTKVSQGMFSGTRSTDFINTVLSYCYFRIASGRLERSGLKPSHLYHSHQGDDVYISNKNVLWAGCLFYTMSEMGFIFQPMKQMFGPGRGEFLRVLYQNGSAQGYLIRSVVNYLLQQLQGRQPVQGQDWLALAHEATHTMARRGLDLLGARLLWYDIYQYKGFVKDHAQDMSGVRIPLRPVVASKEYNGLMLGPPGLVPAQLKQLPAMPRPKEVSRVNLRSAPSTMTDDWLAHVSAKLPRARRVIAAESLRELNLSESYVNTIQGAGKMRFARNTKREFADYIENVDRVKISPSSGAAEFVLTDSPEEVVATHKTSLAAYKYKHRGEQNFWGRYKKLDLIMSRSANLHIPAPTHTVTPLTDTLSKIITKSHFKNVAKTAVAYNITKQQALQLILTEHSENSQAAAAVVSIAFKLMASGRTELLDALMNPSSGYASYMEPWMDKKYLLIVQSLLTQSLVGAAVPQKGRTLPHLLSTRQQFVHCVYQGALTTAYPAKQILT